VDLFELDLDRLGEHLRRSCPAAEAESTLWAFREVLDCARRDPDSLPHLFAATACLLAFAERSSPRSVLEAYFRRAVSDERWRELYLPLLD